MKMSVCQNMDYLKKSFLGILLVIIVVSCGVRQTRTYLTSGDYDNAIKTALEGLKGNKNAKGKQEYVYLLEEAFAKAKARDLSNLELWNGENNPNNFEKIYNTYWQLNNRQELIKPILPLQLIKENRLAIFPFENYTQNIIESKNKFSEFLYNNSIALIATRDKMNCRRAYDDLNYLESINPNYRDSQKLMDQARFLGIDFVKVTTENDTNLIIPSRLQNDLLDFSTFGLNDKWTVYHTNPQNDVHYDYGLVIRFRQITISPEQVNQKEFMKEKQIKDGTKPLIDGNGNQVKDDKGNVVMVDNLKTVRVSIYEFRQFKTVEVTAKVDYVDLKGNQMLNTFPLSSNFTFENVYSNYNGDKRACEEAYLSFFERKSVPFPTNEQMVYDCGEDLKAKLKAIIVNNRFRK